MQRFPKKHIVIHAHQVPLYESSTHRITPNIMRVSALKIRTENKGSSCEVLRHNQVTRHRHVTNKPRSELQ
jgi:hypothetical protein